MTAKRIIAAVETLCAAFLIGALFVPNAGAQDRTVHTDSVVDGRESAAPTGSAPAEICPVEEFTVFAHPELDGGSRFALPPYAARLSSTRLDSGDRPGRSIGIRRQPDASALTSAPARVFFADPDDPAPIDIDLPNLAGDGTRLDGLFARVRSVKLDPGDVSAPGKENLADFRFDPILGVGAGLECTSAAPEDVTTFCSRFDAVNVYYHIDKVAREYWIDGLGVDIDFQAEVMTHAAGDGAVAYPEFHEIRLRAGDIFKKNAALEDEIIYHEYAHLVMARLGFEVDIGSPTQERALNEGYADYFAASYTDDPRIGEWVVTCPDRQHCVDEFGRENDEELTRLNLSPDEWNWNRGSPDHTLQYGFCLRYHEGDTKCKPSYGYFTDAYVWGMIWSNTLWDMRRELGAAIVDPVFVEAIRMHHAGGNPDVDFTEAAGHVILANRTVNGGQSEELIRELFMARGFMIPIVDSSEQETQPGTVSVAVFPNPAAATAWVQVEAPGPEEIRIRVVDLLGRVTWSTAPRQAHLGTNVIPVDVSGLTPGVYLVEAVTSSERVSARLTVAR